MISKSENLDKFGVIVKHTVFPSLKQSQQLVLICLKSFSFQSLITNSPSPCSPLPPQQTALFPKPKSEILASVNAAHDMPGEPGQSVQPQILPLGILSTKLLKGRQRCSLLPKEDVSL